MILDRVNDYTDLDVVAVSEGGLSVHWFQGPPDVLNRDFPWEVFNIVEFTDAAPSAIATGDIDGNGTIDVVVGVGNKMRWYIPAEDDPRMSGRSSSLMTIRILMLSFALWQSPTTMAMG